MRLTKSVVDKLVPIPNKAQIFYRDDELKGFAIRITSNGVKSFIVEKLVNGKVRRITLGRYGELTVEQARKEAQKVMGKIATGIDPIAEKLEAKFTGITLVEVFQDYLSARKNLKFSTLSNYQKVFSTIENWKNKPILSITKDNIAKRHKELGEERGAAMANSVMRVLRALFNFSIGQYENSHGKSLISENPVKRLSQTRAWYRINPRQTFIKSHELAEWYKGVLKLTNHTLRDYLLVLIFTGLRREEAATLKWEQIDFKRKTLTIFETKNNQSHTLPLSDYLYQLFIKSKERSNSHFVFPGTGKGGYIVEPRKQMQKVIDTSGVKFILHDLRRTFITIAESLDISAYALKRLLNHKMNNDITADYIIRDVERLRKPMQQITDYLLIQMTITPSNNLAGNDDQHPSRINECLE